VDEILVVVVGTVVVSVNFLTLVYVVSYIEVTIVVWVLYNVVLSVTVYGIFFVVSYVVVKVVGS
jgi:hypothetical protein